MWYSETYGKKVHPDQRYGEISEEDVFKILAEKLSDKTREYDELAIGTDSQVNHVTKVIEVIYIHEKGKGGIYFYAQHNTKKYSKTQIGERMYYEAQCSLDVAHRLISFLYEWDIDYSHTFIDVDLGRKGKTREYIDGITGWITSEGFTPRVKPGSLAASLIADRHTK